MTDSVEKPFLGDERNLLRLLVRFARDDARGIHRFAQKQPPTFVSSLRSVAARETAKNPLSRDFAYRSIFDFFNSIDPNRKSKAVFAPFHVFCHTEISLTQIKTLLAAQDILKKKHFGLR